MPPPPDSDAASVPAGGPDSDGPRTPWRRRARDRDHRAGGPGWPDRRAGGPSGPLATQPSGLAGETQCRDHCRLAGPELRAAWPGRRRGRQPE